MSYIISQRIKTLRIERGLSQEDVAVKLDMSRQRYSRIESNQVQVTFRAIEQLADIFGISTTEITKASEEKKPLKVLFRENNFVGATDEVIEKIQTILEYMNAHERLYYKMKEGKSNGKA
jgi:transcriptional regulator with XRE-family HTH domain